MWTSLARLAMLQALLHGGKAVLHRVRYSKISQCSASTLPNKMSADNIVQLCGNDNHAVRLALKYLRNGEVIAVPTDTVYGLAVDSENTSAIHKLYELKGRDSNKPLAICVGCVSDVKKYGMTSNLPKGLLKKLLPGPVTVLLNRKDKLNPKLNPGLEKVGIRVPEITWHPFIQFVASALGHPLALTSANLSNEPNCIYVDEFKALWPQIGMIFDTQDNKTEPPDKSREGSTIVDLSEEGKFRITRPGVAYTQTLQILQKYGLEELS